MSVILTPDPNLGQPFEQTGLLYLPEVASYSDIAAISTTDIAFFTLIQVVINGNLEFWQFLQGVITDDANNISADDDGGYWHRVGGFGVSLMAAARVTTTAAQHLTSGVPAAITFSESRFNSGEWSLTSNPSRITAIADGIYVLSGSVSFGANPAGYRKLALRVNGSTEIASNQLDGVSSVNPTNLSVSSIYKLVAGDYVELVALQTSGGDLDVLKANQYSPELSATRLSSLTPLSIDNTTPPPSTTPPGTGIMEMPFYVTDAGWFRVWSGAYPASGNFNLRRANNGDGQTSDTVIDWTIIAGTPEGIININRNSIPIVASPSIDGVRVLHEAGVGLAYVEVHLLRGGDWTLEHHVNDAYDYLDAPFLVPDSVAYATASLTYGLKPNVVGGTGAVSIPTVETTEVVNTWAPATGTPARTAFDTATATLTQVAERMKAIIDDLITAGIFREGIPTSMVYNDMLALAASLVAENSVANVTDIFRVSVAPDTTVQGIYVPVGTFNGHNFYKVQGYEYEAASQGGARQCYWSSEWTTWTISNSAAATNLYHSGASEANPWSVAQWKNQASANVAVTTVGPNIAMTYNALTDAHTAMILSGSSYGWNGLYLRGADLNARRRYYLVGTGTNNARIEWSGTEWDVRDDSDKHYYSLDDVATPDLVTEWRADNSDSITVIGVNATDLMSGLTVGGGATYNGIYTPIQATYNVLGGRKLVYRRTDNAYYIQNDGTLWYIAATLGGAMVASDTDGDFPWNAAWTAATLTVQQNKVASPGWVNGVAQGNITGNLTGNWHL